MLTAFSGVSSFRCPRVRSPAQGTLHSLADLELRAAQHKGLTGEAPAQARGSSHGRPSASWEIAVAGAPVELSLGSSLASFRAIKIQSRLCRIH